MGEEAVGPQLGIINTIQLIIALRMCRGLLTRNDFAKMGVSPYLLTYSRLIEIFFIGQPDLLHMPPV